MKKIAIVLVMLVTFLQADDTALILQEIKDLRTDMNKRFEQVDKRFEQVDKRLDFAQNLIIAMMAIVLATPFYLKRRDEKDQEKLEKINSMLIVLREMASQNPKVEHAMKIVGL